MSEPNPALIWETITAHQRSAALKAGVELGVFDALGDGPSTSAELASRAGVAERGIRILCDFLTVQGLLSKADGRYAHTPTSAVFLDRRSPVSMAPTLPFLMSDKIMQAGRLMTESIRQNRTALEEPLAGDEVQEWVTFARTMHPMMGGPADFIASVIMGGGIPSKVLDVASSHGLFSIAVARVAPQCEIVALDFPSVLDVTAQNTGAAGVHVKLLPGSAFTTDLGTGYDAIIVTNLFHHFPAGENIALMRRFHAALRPGGRMLTLEFVPNEDRISPPASATFSMMMLTNTPAGDAFTMAEYNEMLDAAGFGAREIMDVPMSPQQLIVATA
jgi:2-polyprenyl-3-methyl-5-hydroxy-6-metoxy-1,4-benzoquinol methylase